MYRTDHDSAFKPRYPRTNFPHQRISCDCVMLYLAGIMMAGSSTAQPYLEKTSEAMRAWEIKLNPASKAKIPLSFKRSYPDAETDILTPANYDEFLLPE